MAKFDTRKTRILKVVDAVFRPFYTLTKKKTKKPKLDGPLENIAIIAAMRIGDTIMLIPSLRVLRRSFPKANITIIGEPIVEVILGDQSLVDHFIIIKTPWMNKGSFIANIFRTISTIRKNNLEYDWAIDFRGDWRNIFLMSFINARRRISFNYSGGDYMLTDIVPIASSTGHYIDEWLDLLKALGCQVKDGDHYPQLVVNGSNLKRLRDFKLKNNLENRFVIGVHPGASNRNRMWSEENYSKLLLRISRAYPSHAIILFEGPNERESVAKIIGILKEAHIEPGVVNVGLKEYTVLMKCVNMLVCNDSGAGHIAGAYNIPSVVLFGKSDPETVKPFNKSASKIISKRQSDNDINDAECFSAITVDEVFNAVTDLINGDLQLQNPV